ncbi:hypothetical protein B0H11DRAFT_1939738 [Mycena galericulata]|nr:hypothetical protein B0H11DRAFT_1939738 [Mycena galericulata]
MWYRVKSELFAMTDSKDAGDLLRDLLPKLQWTEEVHPGDRQARVSIRELAKFVGDEWLSGDCLDLILPLALQGASDVCAVDHYWVMAKLLKEYRLDVSGERRFDLDGQSALARSSREIGARDIAGFLHLNASHWTKLRVYKLWGWWLGMYKAGARSQNIRLQRMATSRQDFALDSVSCGVLAWDGLRCYMAARVNKIDVVPVSESSSQRAALRLHLLATFLRSWVSNSEGTLTAEPPLVVHPLLRGVGREGSESIPANVVIFLEHIDVRSRRKRVTVVRDDSITENKDNVASKSAHQTIKRAFLALRDVELQERFTLEKELAEAREELERAKTAQREQDMTALQLLQQEIEKLRLRIGKSILVCFPRLYKANAAAENTAWLFLLNTPPVTRIQEIALQDVLQCLETPQFPASSWQLCAVSPLPSTAFSLQERVAHARIICEQLQQEALLANTHVEMANELLRIQLALDAPIGCIPPEGRNEDGDATRSTGLHLVFCQFSSPEELECDWSTVSSYEEDSTGRIIMKPHLDRLTSLTVLCLVRVTLPQEHIHMPCLQRLTLKGWMPVPTPNITTPRLAFLEVRYGEGMSAMLNALILPHIQEIVVDGLETTDILHAFDLCKPLVLTMDNDVSPCLLDQLSLLSSVKGRIVINLPTVMNNDLPVWVDALGRLLAAQGELQITFKLSRDCSRTFFTTFVVLAEPLPCLIRLIETRSTQRKVINSEDTYASCSGQLLYVLPLEADVLPYGGKESNIVVGMNKFCQEAVLRSLLKPPITMSVTISLDNAFQIINLLKAHGKMKALEDRVRTCISGWTDSALFECAPAHAPHTSEAPHTCSCGATCDGGAASTKGTSGDGKGGETTRKRKRAVDDPDTETAEGGRCKKRGKSPCQRGGVPWQGNDAPTNEAVQNTPAREAYLFLDSLYNQAEADPAQPACRELLNELMDRFSGCGWNLTEETETVTSTVVVELLERCLKDDKDQVYCDVKWMVNLVRIIDESRKNKSERSKADVWRKEGKGKKTQNYFRKVIGQGSKLIALAAGADVFQGSLYLVILLAMCRKSRIFADLEIKVVKSLVEALRQPEPGQSNTPMGKLIIEKVVPFVSFFSSKLPLKVKNVNCDDLAASDAWFQHFILQDFSPPERRLDLWDMSVTETNKRWEWEKILASERNIVSLNIVSRPLLVDIPSAEQEKLGPVETVNKTVIYPVDKSDREIWTEKQRQIVTSTVLCPKNPEQLVDMVMLFVNFSERFAYFLNKMDTHFDEDGVRKTDEWIRIEPSLFEGQSLKIEVKNPQEGEDTLICDIMGDLPESIRKNLIESLQEAMAVRGGQGMVPKDSAQAREDGDLTYKCIHFVFYGRGGTDGKDTPTDVHPRNLSRGDKKMNYHQLVPVPSKEMQDNQPKYIKICDGLAKLFNWMSAALERHHPGKFTILEIVADALPYHQSSPAHPFTGFVLNLNIVTAVHRDKKDLVKFCGVIDIGDHSGGELCLLEPGLVIALRHGDMILDQFDWRPNNATPSSELGRWQTRIFDPYKVNKGGCHSFLLGFILEIAQSGIHLLIVCSATSLRNPRTNEERFLANEGRPVRQSSSSKTTKVAVEKGPATRYLVITNFQTDQLLTVANQHRCFFLHNIFDVYEGQQVVVILINIDRKDGENRHAFDIVPLEPGQLDLDIQTYTVRLNELDILTGTSPAMANDGVKTSHVKGLYTDAVVVDQVIKTYESTDDAELQILLFLLTAGHRSQTLKEYGERAERRRKID